MSASNQAGILQVLINLGGVATAKEVQAQAWKEGRLSSDGAESYGIVHSRLTRLEKWGQVRRTGNGKFATTGFVKSSAPVKGVVFH